MRAERWEVVGRTTERHGFDRHDREGIGPRPFGYGRLSLHDSRTFAAILAGLTVVIVPLSLYVWQRTQPRRDLERRARSGRAREALARLQV